MIIKLIDKNNKICIVDLCQWKRQNGLDYIVVYTNDRRPKKVKVLLDKCNLYETSGGQTRFQDYFDDPKHHKNIMEVKVNLYIYDFLEQFKKGDKIKPPSTRKKQGNISIERDDGSGFNFNFERIKKQYEKK